MKELIETLYSIPLDIFRPYVLVKPRCQSNTLLTSLVEAEAIQAGIALSALQESHDILQTALQKFNARLTDYWRQHHPEIPPEKRVSLSEEDRQATMQILLQTYCNDHYIDASLLTKIEKIANDYQAVGNGYNAFSLTSIYTALSVAFANQGVLNRYFAAKPTLLTWDDAAIWKLYAALTDPPVISQIRFMGKLQTHCQGLEQMVEAYIDEYMLTMVVTINKPMVDDSAANHYVIPDCNVSEDSVAAMFEQYPDLQSALHISHCLSMLTVCLYSKGKSAAERVALFHQYWFEQMRMISGNDNQTLDYAVMRFNQSIRVLFSALQLPGLALFSTAAAKSLPLPPVVLNAVENSQHVVLTNAKL